MLTHSAAATAAGVVVQVGDVHRSLLYGGVFMYPADKKSPHGKLRLLYECNPIAFIVEQAGGLAVRVGGGRAVQRVREVVPVEIHERCPVVVGSREAVLEVVRLYEEWGKSGGGGGSEKWQPSRSKL